MRFPDFHRIEQQPIIVEYLYSFSGWSLNEVLETAIEEVRLSQDIARN